jgi:hypothetical protein
VERAGVPGLSPDLHDVPVRLLAPGGAVHTATSAGDGMAVARVAVPERPGDYEIRVEIADASEYLAEPVTLLLAVRRAEEPFLVVDLDGTVTGASYTEVMKGDPEPFPGAAAVLRRISGKVSILYLTHRDDALLARSREWLRRHDFPRAPVLCSDLRLSTLSGEKYKGRRLHRLRRRFIGPWTGIGDRDEDARAYHANDVRPFVIEPAGEWPDGLPEETGKVRSWLEFELVR